MLTRVFLVNGAPCPLLSKQRESMGIHCLVYGKFYEEERDLLIVLAVPRAKTYSLIESCYNTGNMPHM